MRALTLATVLGLELALVALGWWAGVELRSPRVSDHERPRSPEAQDLPAPAEDEPAPLVEPPCVPEEDEALSRRVMTLRDEVEAPQRLLERVRAEVEATWEEPRFAGQDDPNLYERGPLTEHIQAVLEACGHEGATLAGVDCEGDHCVGIILGNLSTGRSCGPAWDEWSAVYGSGMEKHLGAATCADGQEVSALIFAPSAPDSQAQMEAYYAGYPQCEDLEPDACTAARTGWREQRLAEVRTAADAAVARQVCQ